MYCHYERQLSFKILFVFASYEASKIKGVGLYLVSCEFAGLPKTSRAETLHLFWREATRYIYGNHSEHKYLGSDVLTFVLRTVERLPGYTRQSARSVRCTLSLYRSQPQNHW